MLEGKNLKRLEVSIDFARDPIGEEKQREYGTQLLKLYQATAHMETFSGGRLLLREVMLSRIGCSEPDCNGCREMVRSKNPCGASH